jgi:CHAT domain-containing protein
VDELLADLDDAAKAAALGRRLLPLELLPPAGETLYVVTDGPLGSLPFAALRIEGRWLVERHPLVFVPSLEALARFLDRPRRIATAGSEGGRLLLGDPSDDLPGARQEVLSVAKLLGSRAFLGKEASRRRLFSASSPDLLHLATHGGLAPEGPWLMLADGRLGAAAILRRRRAPRLAVLASCASAARPGQEMWGSLGAFFLAAGSESVVATLYSVPDESTRELVLRFYEEGGLEQPAVALARAQKILLGEGRPASQWAPFVVLGLGG